MNDTPFDPVPKSDELLFLPLGGAGEIGKNLNLYGHRGKWLLIDVGISFAGPDMPGIDVIMPDPRFIIERREDLVGIVLTHAHEDHMGAVPYLWEQLRVPIYATPFTASLLRRKWPESEWIEGLKIHRIPLAGRVSIAPFALELITLTHSIPEPNAVVIRTQAGTVLHTGDWKLDPEPIIGETADVAALRRLGEEGVLAMVGDSTNALLSGNAGSEAEVKSTLERLIGQSSERVFVTCFATNVARLHSITQAALANGRDATLIGRSLWRVEEAARENGYFDDLPSFIPEGEAAFIPRNKIVVICTGSQGEPNSALARIARGEHPAITLEEGDRVIFSSRVIPGNERAIGELQNALVRRKAELVVGDIAEGITHVSGHPNQEELAEMYGWIRPKIAIAVHGEERHMAAHTALAKQHQVPFTFAAQNGQVIRLSPGQPKVLGAVSHGVLALDGHHLISADSPILSHRRRVQYNGEAFVTLMIHRDGRLDGVPLISAPGLLDLDLPEDQAILAEIREKLDGLMGSLSFADRLHDDRVEEAARIALRRVIRAARSKRPPVTVHIIRLP